MIHWQSRSRPKGWKRSWINAKNSLLCTHYKISFHRLLHCILIHGYCHQPNFCLARILCSNLTSSYTIKLLVANYLPSTICYDTLTSHVVDDWISLTYLFHCVQVYPFVDLLKLVLCVSLINQRIVISVSCSQSHSYQETDDQRSAYQTTTSFFQWNSFQMGDVRSICYGSCYVSSRA